MKKPKTPAALFALWAKEEAEEVAAHGDSALSSASALEEVIDLLGVLTFLMLAADPTALSEALAHWRAKLDERRRRTEEINLPTKHPDAVSAFVERLIEIEALDELRSVIAYKKTRNATDPRYED